MAIVLRASIIVVGVPCIIIGAPCMGAGLYIEVAGTDDCAPPGPGVTGAGVTAGPGPGIPPPQLEQPPPM